MKRLAVFFLVLVLSLVLALSAAWAQTRKQGSSLDVHIDYRGVGEPSTVTVFSDPAETRRKEMLFHFYSRPDREAYSFIIVPPKEPGVHELSYTFLKDGEWSMLLRYGLGIDMYRDRLRFTLDQPTRTIALRGRFESELRPGAPSYVQSLGFGVFGLIVLPALVLVIWVMRWIGVRKAELGTNAL